MKRISIILGALALAAGGSAFYVTSSDSASVATADNPEVSYLILGNGNKLKSSLVADIEAAGGTLTLEIQEIGVATAVSSNPAFAASLDAMPGYDAVVEDVVTQAINPLEIVELDAASVDNTGQSESFYGLQWGLQAIDAPTAWAGGLRGSGVRVAVLDSGIDADNPDLAPNLNTALSASFVPGEHWDIQPGRYFNHGTHVAGTIGAAENGLGVIGVAPDVELVGVKVLSEYTGSGSGSGIMAGIVYAANINADIINMSLGSYFPRSIYGASASHYINAYSRATTYAYQRGVTIIASAGNSAIDMDHDADGVKLPADAAHVLSISATAPAGWAGDPSGSLDHPSSYTNYGQSGVDFAAPGGDFSTYPAAGWHYDMVLSTGSGAWYFSAGTSMAAPHASGVAALIIGANGGDMHPAHVAAALAHSADDLGQPGNDDYYGGGRVNAGNLAP